MAVSSDEGSLLEKEGSRCTFMSLLSKLRTTTEYRPQMTQSLKYLLPSVAGAEFGKWAGLLIILSRACLCVHMLYTVQCSYTRTFSTIGSIWVEGRVLLRDVVYLG
jgi:hypothetical protein